MIDIKSLDLSKARTLSKDERETVIYKSADRRNVWFAFSEDVTIIKKLAKISKKCKRKGVGYEFELEDKQVLLRKPPKKRMPKNLSNLKNVNNTDEEESVEEDTEE